MGILEVRLNRGRPLLVVLVLAVRKGTGRTGASVPSAVVGATRTPVALVLLIEIVDGDRLKKDGMIFDFFFSGPGADVDGGSTCATSAGLAMTAGAAGGGFW